MATIKVTDENFDQIVLKSDKPFRAKIYSRMVWPL
jgi:hypothetical protein